MKENSGVLYIVSTPIGNLEDITLRAVRVLSEVDIIACEDTRHSIKLLNHLDIKKPLISYHDNNRIMRAHQLIEKLREGNDIALISDAGTPLISDPGEELVSMAVENGIKVTVIPGCTASIAALTLSGLPTGRFVFEGFLPQKRTDRIKHLENIQYEDRTIIFYEGPHRLKAMLKDVLEVLGDRKCAVVRELTKIHEEVVRGTVSQALSHFETHNPRGEFVIVIEGSKNKAPSEEKSELTELSVEEHVNYYINQGQSRMQAMKSAAKDRGITKREVYAILNTDK
ncbi:MAG: 16S rRNA (cytidine(1402)-2'-O)-methyltransferase [Clostridiaceae bacterium]|nr:16S rRNA (cytidine(1402)-2'-O)-methyltransferase [Clostridiaceae bacterium]